jgi:hypothetical protein
VVGHFRREGQEVFRHDLDSYSLGLAIGFGRVDLLAGLLDLLKDSGVVQRVFSCDDGGLGIERDVV